MPDKRNALNDLLESDREAQRYFNSLPDRVRDFIMQSDENYSSLPELQSAAERVLQANGVNHD